MTLCEQARAAASRKLTAPSPFSVLLQLTPELDDVAMVQFGFQQPVQSRWRGLRLRNCWIDVSGDGTRVVTGAAGEFGAAQVARLTAANVGFPRPDLHIQAGVLQPDDVLVAAGARDRSMIHLQAISASTTRSSRGGQSRREPTACER